MAKMEAKIVRHRKWLFIYEASELNPKFNFRASRSYSTRSTNVYSKLKLVWTTLLIVSTFSLSWGLCVLYFVIVCEEGCMLIYNENIGLYLSLFLSSSVNILVSF